MTEQEKRTIEMAVSDAIVEKPVRFNVGKKKFSVSPPGIGKLQILAKYYLALEIDENALQAEPHLETFRICEAKADIVCSLMAIATFDKKEDLLNDELIAERADFFKWNTNPTDFSTILLALLTQTNYVNFISSIRLTEMLRINKPKTEK